MWESTRHFCQIVHPACFSGWNLRKDAHFLDINFFICNKTTVTCDTAWVYICRMYRVFKNIQVLCFHWQVLPGLFIFSVESGRRKMCLGVCIGRTSYEEKAPFIRFSLFLLRRRISWLCHAVSNRNLFLRVFDSRLQEEWKREKKGTHAHAHRDSLSCHHLHVAVVAQ